MPTLRQLEYLVAVAETLHFRKAAERVHTTQPTLSEQLKALEERLGSQLIERSQRQVLITPVGAEVVKIARRMLADANEIRAVSSQGSQGLGGLIKLGVPATVGPYLLPRLLPELRKEYDDLRLYIREAVPNHLLGELENGKHDLVISLLPVFAAGIHVEPLVEEQLFLAVSKDHEFAGAGKVERSALRDADVLTLSEGHQLHDAVRDISRAVGANLRTDYEGTSLDTLREMVAIDLGVTFLPGFYVDAFAKFDTNISMIELGGERLSRQIGIFWRNTSSSHERYLAFAEQLRNAISANFPVNKVLR